jgi:hypothetical protein
MIVSEELAQHAQDFLDDAAVQNIFSVLEARYIDNFRSTHANAKDKREEAFYMLRAIDELKSQLSSLANEPKVMAFRRKRIIQTNI